MALQFPSAAASIPFNKLVPWRRQSAQASVHRRACKNLGPSWVQMLPSFNSQHLLSHERLPELGSNRAIQTANDNVLSRKKPPVLSLQSRGSNFAIINMNIDNITSEIIDRLPLSGSKRKNISPSYRNQALRTLARALHLAREWKVLQHVPRIHLEQENGREELITPERERLLLRYAGPTLRAVLILVQDTAPDLMNYSAFLWRMSTGNAGRSSTATARQRSQKGTCRLATA